VFGIRRRLEQYLEDHPAALVALAVAFIALGTFLLATDPAGHADNGIPVWLSSPILIVLMLAAAIKGTRRIVARHRSDASVRRQAGRP
jgi:uncharacterized protein (DUF983 family)